MLRGGIDFLILDSDGNVIDRHELTAGSPLIQIDPSTWHTAYIRESNTVVLEVKPGPYRPNEFAPWAPDEGTVEAERMLLKLKLLPIGGCII